MRSRSDLAAEYASLRTAAAGTGTQESRSRRERRASGSPPSRSRTRPVRVRASSAACSRRPRHRSGRSSTPGSRAVEEPPTSSNARGPSWRRRRAPSSRPPSSRHSRSARRRYAHAASVTAAVADVPTLAVESRAGRSERGALRAGHRGRLGAVGPVAGAGRVGRARARAVRPARPRVRSPRRRARTDALTGLPNRRGMEELLNRAAAMSSATRLAARRTHDRHRPVQGDQRRAWSRRRRRRHPGDRSRAPKATRDDDVAGRWGGEEFLVFVHDADVGGARPRSPNGSG